MKVLEKLYRAYQLTYIRLSLGEPRLKLDGHGLTLAWHGKFGSCQTTCRLVQLNEEVDCGGLNVVSFIRHCTWEQCEEMLHARFVVSISLGVP